MKKGTQTLNNMCRVPARISRHKAQGVCLTQRLQIRRQVTEMSGNMQKSILCDGSLDPVDKYAVRENRVRTRQVDEAVLRLTLVAPC